MTKLDHLKTLHAVWMLEVLDMDDYMIFLNGYMATHKFFWITEQAENEFKESVNNPTMDDFDKFSKCFLYNTIYRVS